MSHGRCRPSPAGCLGKLVAVLPICLASCGSLARAGGQITRWLLRRVVLRCGLLALGTGVPRASGLGAWEAVEIGRRAAAWLYLGPPKAVALLCRSSQKLDQPKGKPQNIGCCLLLGVSTQHPVPPAPRRGGTGEGSVGLSGLEKTSFRFALHLQLHS